MEGGEVVSYNLEFAQHYVLLASVDLLPLLRLPFLLSFSALL